MRIALVTDTPFLCEDTMYLNELQKRFSNLGHEVSVFVIRASGPVASLDSSTGIIRMVKLSLMLSSLARFDVIHVQFTFPLGFALAALSKIRLLRRPLVLHTHGNDIFTVPEIGYGIRRTTSGQKIASFTWTHSDRIIAVCNKSKAEVESTLKHKSTGPDKVSLLHNGIDESLFRPNADQSIKNDNLRGDADFVFISMASLVPVKNQARMSKAFIQLVEEYRSKKLKLFLVGAKSQHYTVSLPDHKDIVYLGKRPHQDLPGLYSMGDAFVLPSLSEAHPWSLLEAMGCGLPAIASNVGGIPESLSDGRFLVDPRSIDDITAKMKSMIDLGEHERRQVGDKNRKVVLDAFTLDRHVQKLYKIFDSVAA